VPVVLLRVGTEFINKDYLIILVNLHVVFVK
jgi:hypothetical protein